MILRQWQPAAAWLGCSAGWSGGGAAAAAWGCWTECCGRGELNGKRAEVNRAAERSWRRAVPIRAQPANRLPTSANARACARRYTHGTAIRHSRLAPGGSPLLPQPPAPAAPAAPGAGMRCCSAGPHLASIAGMSASMRVPSPPQTSRCGRSAKKPLPPTCVANTAARHSSQGSAHAKHMQLAVPACAACASRASRSILSLGCPHTHLADGLEAKIAVVAHQPLVPRI